MRNHVVRLRFLCLLLVIALLLSGIGGGSSWAQDADGEVPTILILGHGYSQEDEQHILIEELAENLRNVITQHNIEAVVEVDYRILGNTALAPHIPLIIRINPWAIEEERDFAVWFVVRKLPMDSLFSAPRTPLYSNFLHPVMSMDSAISDTSLSENAVMGLFHYATNNCEQALEYLDRALAHVDTLNDRGYQLALYSALCLRAEHDYQAALEILQTLHQNPPESLLVDWGDIQASAFIADTLALNFEYSEAIEWDSRNIDQVETSYSALDFESACDDAAAPTSDQCDAFNAFLADTLNEIYQSILSDLYLLRAQHRLYLYEWDAVLEDINTALAFENAPPRAYYYRGLTYYSQNEGNTHELACADFVRYLELETDANSPLIAQAERFVETLENTLSTESEGQ